ncbi:hypothetical protein KO561_04990 [Radiobacillus kanasensis]|uniref:hypothetical protein n=1 Tax=Radiobacillus kanasensis TaxID=2844358 RepID=UPI001E30066C|nr:hypothetical protein [Radiobacillus kanasensis]UFU00310.1 hypothetical protein KO561_04990 [Radiobacillus kanasensis]
MFRAEKLYRVEIVEDIPYKKIRNPLEFTKQNGIWRYKEQEGVIKIGIKGDVIKQWRRKWFSPDEDQENIELFTPMDNPLILVPYHKIKYKYKVLKEY